MYITNDLNTLSTDDLITLYKNGYTLNPNHYNINNLAITCNEGCFPKNKLYLWFIGGFFAATAINFINKIRTTK